MIPSRRSGSKNKTGPLHACVLQCILLQGEGNELTPYSKNKKGSHGKKHALYFSSNTKPDPCCGAGAVPAPLHFAKVGGGQHPATFGRLTEVVANLPLSSGFNTHICIRCPRTNLYYIIYAFCGRQRALRAWLVCELEKVRDGSKRWAGDCTLQRWPRASCAAKRYKVVLRCLGTLCGDACRIIAGVLRLASHLATACLAVLGSPCVPKTLFSSAV